MVSVVLTCGADEVDDLIAGLYELGTTGVIENHGHLEAFFETIEDARVVIAAFASRFPVLRRHTNRDYVAESRSHWQPLPVGERFWLVPDWHVDDPPPGRVRLEYQMGMACGSGAHPCTRLCLQALEKCVRPGDSVLDVGAGSGILLMAARLLGAARIAGCDIDHDSAVLAANKLATPVVFTGSVECVRDASFDVIIVNIGSMVAEQLFPDLWRICKPGGTILLSGFPGGEIPHVPPESAKTLMDGWACLMVPR
ncbi:MAG TPA: 50S ribosomal protein L11 methyltransferase [Bryobacteraceae bacterium]|nr:50S ribosomal protein L11 methyltransferase [Bryobacteraceae bacterium]